MSLCQILVSQDLATFFDLSVWCLSFKALLAWELAISSQLSPPPTPKSDQKALLNFLQPLEPLTIKSCQCFHLKSESEHWFGFGVAWTSQCQRCNVLSGTENRLHYWNYWRYFPVTLSWAWLKRNICCWVSYALVKLKQKMRWIWCGQAGKYWRSWFFWPQIWCRFPPD